MSGGVDSSVSAILLLEQGYNVEGLFMKNWEEDDGTEYCTAKQDLADAQAVCDQLNIKLHLANFSVEYWDNVFEIFLSEYKQGRTPNPDILCNKEIKFKAFLKYANTLGADFIATGHYTQLKYDDNTSTSLLYKGIDENKDQSYFLYGLNQSQLAKVLFPVGGLQKQATRELANEARLVNSTKKDSTGICFIGERRFKDFLNRYIPLQQGDIKTIHDEKIGEHQGLMFYTIGQRQGLGIGGIANFSNSPWFVVDKKIATNTLIVAQGESHPALFKNKLYVKDVHWINPEYSLNYAQHHPNLTAKIRYRQQDQQCSITQNDKGFIIEFTKPQRAITPGQSVVFYTKNLCLGGAIIEHSLN